MVISCLPGSLSLVILRKSLAVFRVSGELSLSEVTSASVTVISSSEPSFSFRVVLEPGQPR